jgi:hypothetical protein
MESLVYDEVERAQRYFQIAALSQMPILIEATVEH